MGLRLLLNDGFKIPIVGLGTGTTNDQAVRDAIKAGYRHNDTSLNYKDSEKTIGKVLKDLLKLNDTFSYLEIRDLYFKCQSEHNLRFCIEKFGKTAIYT
jgi:diketogulonate reductase-like aldo/keto reductase